MSRLAHKVALVTGAGSGFGAGIAQAFVAAGARVGVLDRDAQAAAEISAQLGEQALALTADVTNRDDMSQAIAILQAQFGPIDILVNNAGVGLPPTPLEDLQESDFERVYNVNMKSLFISSQLLIPQMKDSNGGCILNIASTAGVSPRPLLTWYNASKGWVITATKSMAIELAPHNIRVNAINPVAGDTPMLSTFMGGESQANRERFLASIPLGRFSTPTDLGQAATFLCSDEASLITGVAMEIDGGRCI